MLPFQSNRPQTPNPPRSFMKRILLQVLGASFLWAVQNAALEIRLSTYSPAALMMITYLTSLPLAIITLLLLKCMSINPAYPGGTDLMVAVGCAVLFFVADLLFIGAYALKGNATTITLITLSVPVFVVLIKIAWKREYPSVHHLLAFVCLGFALYFIHLGESRKANAGNSGTLMKSE